MIASVKGFTLIELLVVIAIVAVLATVVVLTLNPAELLKQARDSNRVSDLNTLKSAIALYLVDVASTDLDGSSNYQCFVAAAASTTLTNCNVGSRFAISSIAVGSTTNSRAIDGTGWIPVSLSSISAGSPLSVLPIDSRNNTSYYYAYRGSTTTGTFEINADMESTKYSSGQSGDVESNDGGNVSTLFEVGNDPGLDL